MHTAFVYEKDKSSDIEQQPSFSKGGGIKPTGTSYNFDKVWSCAPDDRFGKQFLIRDVNNLDSVVLFMVKLAQLIF